MSVEKLKLDISDFPPCIGNMIDTGSVDGRRDTFTFNVAVHIKKTKAPAKDAFYFWVSRVLDYVAHTKGATFIAKDVRGICDVVIQKNFSYQCNTLKPWCNMAACKKEVD